MAYYDAAILYAGPDKAIADILVQKLKELGLSLWWDQDLAAHQQFSLEQMEDVFTRSRQVVALWSENAIKSDWIRRELELARSLEKRMTFCLIGSTSTGTKRLLASLPEFYWDYYFADLRSDTETLNNDAIERLALILTPQLAHSIEPGASIPLPQRRAARSWRRALSGAMIPFLILQYYILYSRGLLPDLPFASVGRLPPRSLLYSGLILCLTGALLSGSRQILELVAAWRIVKELRTLGQREKDY